MMRGRCKVGVVVVALAAAGCGSSGRPVAHVARTSTVMVTTTRTSPAAATGPGYLNPATLEEGVVAAYNRTPPLWAHATSATCTVNETTATATCTLRTNHGPAVEPVSIAGDGSNYDMGPGMG